MILVLSNTFLTSSFFVFFKRFAHFLVMWLDSNLDENVVTNVISLSEVSGLFAGPCKRAL